MIAYTKVHQLSSLECFFLSVRQFFFSGGSPEKRPPAHNMHACMHAATVVSEEWVVPYCPQYSTLASRLFPFRPLISDEECDRNGPCRVSIFSADQASRFVDHV